jgi:phenylacetate-coenzyme A ligase PaaK-like adenylate-forming protein
LPERKHLWRGEWVGDDEVIQRLEELPITVQSTLIEPLDIEVVLVACDRLSAAPTDSALSGVGDLLTRDALERRLRRELATAQPFRLTRPEPRVAVFEAWAPLGLLVHVTPTGALAVLSAVEGLLTGNMNVVLAAEPPLSVMAKLGALDPTGQIASRLVILHNSAEHDRWLRLACALADGVATWDGEDVTSYLPAGCRLVRREHKISIAYLTRDAWQDESTLTAFAEDMRTPGRLNAKTVYLDTDLAADIRTFAERLGPIPAEAGEVRIEPVPRNRLMETLWPMRRHLWTVGIAGKLRDVAELSRVALAAGARRVTTLGGMSGIHDNEPNDKCFPLQRYSRRVSVEADERFASYACLDDLVAARPVPPPAAEMTPTIPVLTKTEAQRRIQLVPPEYAQLYFYSGGTTGPPGVSVYTYDDYDANTRATAEGLMAAGLDPRHDRTANLFYSDLGGGYASFFGILERLTATQLPIAAIPDLRSVVAILIKHRVDTLLGMPSYLWQLFHAEEAALRAYGGIRKIFYAGEHISPERRRWIQDEFNVELLKPAAYTTTDLGPLGYQCTHITGTVYHLQTDLHHLEILDLDSDRPAERGRLVFTRKIRRGQHLERYEMGDIGQWVSGDCGCGRQSPRFELLGRHGDIMRIAARLIDYRRLVQVAEEQLGYAGDLQLVLDHDDDRERLTLRLDEQSIRNADAARRTFLTSYDDLRTAVEQELLILAVETVDVGGLERTPNSGKLRAVVDLRSRS